MRLRLRPRSIAAIPTGIPALRRPIFRQTLLPASTVGTGVASRAVIAESAAVGPSIRLLPVTARRIALLLVEVGPTLSLVEVRTVLRRICASAVLLTQAATIRVVQSGAILILIESWLIGATQLLTVVLPRVVPIVLKLLLIVFLVESGGAEVRVAGVVVEIVGAVIVVIDVVPVIVRVIDVPVVVVIAIDESI